MAMQPNVTEYPLVNQFRALKNGDNNYPISSAVKDVANTMRIARYTGWNIQEVGMLKDEQVKRILAYLQVEEES